MINFMKFVSRFKLIENNNNNEQNRLKKQNSTVDAMIMACNSIHKMDKNRTF